MNDSEIDQSYLTELFVSKLNQVDSDSFQEALELILQNKCLNFSSPDANYLFSLIQNLVGPDYSAEHFYRQIKYLVNKGVYNRLSKKFRNDLFSLNISEAIVDLLVETQRKYMDTFDTNNKVDKTLVDFSIETQMPVLSSNYNITNSSLLPNEDYRKQNLVFTFNVNSEKEEEQTLNFQLDKSRVASLFAEIEKIQEQLDKLH